VGVPAAHVQRRVAQAQVEADRLRHGPQLAGEVGARPAVGQGGGVGLPGDRPQRGIGGAAGVLDADVALPQAGEGLAYALEAGRRVLTDGLCQAHAPPLSWKSVGLPMVSAPVAPSMLAGIRLLTASAGIT